MGRLFRRSAQEGGPWESISQASAKNWRVSRKSKAQSEFSGNKCLPAVDAQQTPLGNIRSVETAGANITACVKATKVWIMGPSCGVTLEAAHCVLHGGGAAQADVFPL